MVKGLDVGYAYTKAYDGNKTNFFRSSYSSTDTSVIGTTPLVIDDVPYYVGRGNIMTSDFNKTENALNKVCTIFDIMNDTDIYLCVGLPVSQYKTQRKKLKESIMKYNDLNVMYGDEVKKIDIKDVFVVMQGISSLYTLKDDPVGDYIIIDIGGLTIDVSYVEFGKYESDIKLCDTIYKGLRTIYPHVIDEVNNRFELKLDISYCDKILKSNAMTVKGKKESLEFLKPYFRDYLDEICEEIKLKYPVDTVPIYITGGGSNLLSEGFRNRFSSVSIIEDSQFANSKGYYKIGCHKFKQKV